MNVTWSKFSTSIGWLAIGLFVIIYGVELIPHHGPPITVRWIRETFGERTLLILNVLIVLSFLALLPYRRPTKGRWQSKGTFVAFVIALMTEMFGWPLLIYLLAPLVDVPIIAHRYFQYIGHWPATLGTVFSLSGVVLIAIGWTQIHQAKHLVTTGLYRYIRHPQYTGLLLFTFGWLLHWPSLVTLILWPFLAGAYVWLTRREEAQLLEEFGKDYSQYAQRSKRFIPFVI